MKQVVDLLILKQTTGMVNSETNNTQDNYFFDFFTTAFFPFFPVAKKTWIEL